MPFSREIRAHLMREIFDGDLDAKESWPGLKHTLTSIFFVELPGIEPDALPGLLASELLFRYISFQFSTSRYLWIPFRVLTASRDISDQSTLRVPVGKRLPNTCRHAIKSLNDSLRRLKLIAIA